MLGGSEPRTHVELSKSSKEEERGQSTVPTAFSPQLEALWLALVDGEAARVEIDAAVALLRARRDPRRGAASSEIQGGPGLH